MEKILNILRYLVAIIGTGFTWLFGAWDMALIILIIFMLLDYGTGVLRGYVNKELSSDIGLRGIARKAVILIVLIVAVCLDRLMNTGEWIFRTTVAYFYIANEGLSLIENCAALGAPVPEKLLDALAQLKDGEKKGVKSNL
ncbi:phage holin family protein [Clostridium sp. ZBS17]|uniref:phage holin family protein n=1 Tax=Clostridium sp. ZBS17 TaxID=2949968 RepID=UPI00207AF6B2|nr:phage holin family protein [Clostridium sp. ZBS17]